jgi:hypothetical protein
MAIRSALGTGVLVIAAYAVIAGVHLRAGQAPTTSETARDANHKPFAIAASPIDWHLPKAEAQCYAFAQDACGCICAAGYSDYNDCTTFGTCPDVSCYTDGTPCLCCSAQ